MRIVIIGGGPAGFFAAIQCASATPRAEIRILEKGHACLSKVAISGGGRCNITHACQDMADFSKHYPRGGAALAGPLRRHGPAETIAWFERHRVPLKTEPDGRMFPVSDRSATVVEALYREAAAAGVAIVHRMPVTGISRRTPAGFRLRLGDGSGLECDRVLLATGGCRNADGGDLATMLGHTLETPVPSLFSLNAPEPWVRELAGVSVRDVEVSLPGTDLCQCGPILFTHRGFSGPAILKFSAWGARSLHALGYRFPLKIRWLRDVASMNAALKDVRERHPRRLVANTPIGAVPARLWRHLMQRAGVPPDVRWSNVTREWRESLSDALLETRVDIVGRSPNKEEFVTCGGVALTEVDFRTMESRICPGLHLAGELLDIDGLTGGFNFQAAWTTGWIAGDAIAK